MIKSLIVIVGLILAPVAVISYTIVDSDEPDCDIMLASPPTPGWVVPPASGTSDVFAVYQQAAHDRAQSRRSPAHR